MRKNLLLKLWTLLAITILVIPVQFAFAEFSVTITNPYDGVTFSAGSTITLTANAVITSGTFKEVRFYNGSSQLGKATGDPLSYSWKNVKSGIYHVFARFKDLELNEVDSDTIRIRVGDLSWGDVIKNGDFDISLSPWQLQNNEGALSTQSIIKEMLFDDSTSVYINITNGGTETWHIQLWQSMPLVPGHNYDVIFYADAEERKTIHAAMQMNKDPWTVYFQQEVIIDGAGEYGPFNYVNTFEDPTNVFKFNIGSNDIDVFFDRVRVIDRSLTSVSSQDLFTKSGAAVQFELFHSYPNPFNMNTNIQYRLSKPANVTLNIYNMQGQLVRTLVDENMPAGLFTAKWDGTNNNATVLPSGVYVYRMEIPAENVQLTSKVLLLK